MDGESAMPYIAQPTASGWETMGGGFDGPVTCLLPWGDGSLYAGGLFQFAGSALANRVARWDGQAWSALAGGVDRDVTSLVRYDADGSGPASAELVVGGWFESAGQVPANSVARWDGAAWHAMGAGLGFFVSDMVAWDKDGDGPGAPVIVAVGQWEAAEWDGTAWHDLGAQFNDVALAAAEWDPDASGPLASRIVVGGEFTRVAGLSCGSPHAAMWDGASWSAFAPYGTSDPWDGVNAILVRGESLMVGGEFRSVGEQIEAKNMAVWDGQVWRPHGQGMNGVPWAATEYDPDGAGPEPVRIVASGLFTYGGGEFMKYIGMYDGQRWSSMSGTDALRSQPPQVLASWDPDGPGPKRRVLALGGDFYSNAPVAVSFIATWDGRLSALGIGMDHRVNALLGIDGNGTSPGRLIAGGYFSRAGEAMASGVAAWDGVEWSPMNTQTGTTVFALTTFDSDGAGPSPAEVIAAGWFIHARGVMRWTGSEWLQVGNGFPGRVDKLTVWDPDGPGGPAPSRLVAAGDFNANSTLPSSHLALWNGASWERLGAGVSSPPSGITTWRSAPGQWQLLIAGRYVVPGGSSPDGLCAWDGANWSLVEPVGGIHAMTPSSESAGRRLWLTGWIQRPGQDTLAGVALWGCGSECAADCDGDEVLSLADFGCFQTKFALGDPYADCNADAAFNLADFGCFQTKFAMGCP